MEGSRKNFSSDTRVIFKNCDMSCKKKILDTGSRWPVSSKWDGGMKQTKLCRHTVFPENPISTKTGCPKSSHVPLNSRTITFDQNFIFTWNCWKMFISLLSTCIQNFSYWHALFVFLSHSVAVAEWSGIQLVDPQMIHFELFYHLVRKGQFNPQIIFV